MTVNYKRKKNYVTGKGSKANKNSVEISLKHMKRLFQSIYLRSLACKAHKALTAFFYDGVAKSIGLKFQWKNFSILENIVHSLYDSDFSNFL